MKATFPITPELTAIAIAYRNQSLIADEVLPIVPVGKQEFKYTKHTLADGFTIPDTKVGRKSAPNQVEFTGSEVTDSTVDHALDDPIPNADIDNAPPNFDPLGHSVEMIMNLIKLDREKRAADLVFASGNYAAANKITLAGASQFSDYANSDPIGIIGAGLDAVVMRPNNMVIGQAAWTKLRSHPDIVKAVLGNAGDKGMVSRRAVADLFELDNLYVGRGFVNTAKKGQSVSLARVWGKHIVLFYRDSTANNQRGTTFGFTARWGSPVAGNEFDKNIGMRGGQMVRAGESVKEVIAASDLGYMIVNAVA